jgi:hypothetical protein
MSDYRQEVDRLHFSKTIFFIRSLVVDGFFEGLNLKIIIIKSKAINLSR